MYQTKTVTLRQFKRTMLSAIFVLIALVSTLNSAMANDENISGKRFPFFIKNVSSSPVSVEIHPSGCYNGRPMPHRITNIVLQPAGQPGDNYEMSLYRDQGSHCDGKYGYFHLKFSNTPGGRNNMVSFQFNNTGDISVQPRTNGYPGSMLPKQGNTYIYETFAPIKGSWDLVCTADNCAMAVTKTQVTSRSKTVTMNKTVENALSASVTTNAEYGAVSGESTASASTKQTISNSMKTCIRSSYSTTAAHPGITLEQIERYGITAKYQYVGIVRYKGETYYIRTQHITYTTIDDVNGPTWLPMDAEDVKHSNLSYLAKKNRN